MRFKITLCISLGIVTVFCFATTPAPYAGYCTVLDRVAAEAVSGSEQRAIALDLLERVALGRTVHIPADVEAKVGVKAGQFQDRAFSEPFVRACAFRIVGETGLPEAVDFLTNLKRVDLGPDDSGALWRAAQEALANTRLNGIADPQLKIEFLERIVEDNTPATHWAREQLCNGGALRSIGILQKSIRRAWSGQYGEDEIRFCETRMQVVSRHSDRVKALGSVLTADDVPDDDRLVRWAIYQLGDMRTPMADAELNRFGAEIGRLTGDSLRRQRLSGFKEEVTYYLERNRQLKVLPPSQPIRRELK